MTEERRAQERFWTRPEVDRRILRQFSWIMAGGLALVGIWMGYRHDLETGRWLGGIAGGILLCGLFLPAVLKPVYLAWMYAARLLGWVNTYLLLGLVFYTLFALIGGGMRLLGRDPLDRRWEPMRKSYWIKREKPLLPREHYERQF